MRIIKEVPMKNKKGLIIGSVIAVIVVLVAAVAILYFTTDLFKTNQQLFYKYIAKTQVVNSAFTQKYRETNNKITQNNRSSLAELAFSSSTQNQETGVADVQTIFNVKSNGLENVALKQSYRDFIFSSNNQNKLTLKYVKDDNTYAIGADNILAKYIAVENTNLKELFKKLGVEDVSTIPDSLPTNYEEILQIEEETKNALMKTYFTLINNHIPSENFYQLTNADKTVVIGVSFSEQEIANLVKSILENAKNDTTLLNLLVTKGQLLGYTNLTVETIQQAIQSLLDESATATYQTDPDYIKLSLIKRGKQVIGLELEINETGTPSVDSTDTYSPSTTNQYNLKLDFSEGNKLILSTRENGLETAVITLTYSYDANSIDCNLQIENKETTTENQTVEEIPTIQLQYQLTNYQTENITQNYTLNFIAQDEQEPDYQLTLTNQITIKQDIQIEKLTTENAAKLNDMSAEQIEELISAIALRVMSLYGENISSLSSGFNISQSSTGRTNNAFNTAAGSTDQANVATNSTVNE